MENELECNENNQESIICSSSSIPMVSHLETMNDSDTKEDFFPDMRNLPKDKLSSANIKGPLSLGNSRDGSWTPTTMSSFNFDDNSLHNSELFNDEVYDAFGRLLPKSRTAWKVCDCETSEDYFVMTGDLIDTNKEPVHLPGELATLIHHLHLPNSERTKEIVEMLFAGSTKKYMRGGFFKQQANWWTVFWHPDLLNQLNSHIVQSFICAALNSRRLLHFIIGVGSDSRIVGCELSDENCENIRNEIERCISTEFIPSLREGLVRFYFHQVCDELGNMIPSLYIAEISINDKVDTLYQLSCGRIFYVNHNSVVERLSFADAHSMLLQRKAELDKVSESRAREKRDAAGLGEPGLVKPSLLRPIFSHSFPYFVLGFLALEFFLLKIRWK